MIRVIRKSALLNYGAGLVAACAALLFLWPGLAANLLRTGAGGRSFMTHEHCYLEIGPLVWMHFASDLLICLSYVAISFTLAYLVYRARRDIPFHWVFVAFGLFIIACGFTHFMEVWTTFGAPRYWLAGYVKLVTAVASVATAVVLPPLVPRMLALVRAAKESGRRGEMERALSALRETNRELEAIIAASPLAIVTLDEAGRVESWSAAAERIFGWRELEVVGEPLPTVPDELREEVARNHAEAVAGRAFTSHETRRRRKDGQLIDVSISTAPLTDADGRSRGVVALVADVTESKRAERALRFQAHLLDTVDQAVIATDADGRITYWNRFAEKLYGWPAAEVMGRNVVDVTPAEFSRGQAEELMARLARGESWTGEFDVRRRDGTTFPALVTDTPILDERGGMVGVVGVSVDITERRRAEEALRLSETRFRTLVEQSPFSTQIFSPDGTTVQVNRAWERLWGVTLADLPGYNILRDEQLEARGVLPYIERAFAGEATAVPPVAYEPDRGEFEGNARWVQAFIYPVKNEDGTVREVVLIHEDITERRRAEEEGARLTRMLEGERRRLKELVAHVPGIVWEAWGEPDASSQRINFVSDYVERMLGYTVEEWLSTPNFWATIVHPEDRERAVREARAKFDSRRGGVSQFRWVRKDGSAVEVEAQSVVILDEAGRPAGMRGVTMDITQRRQAEMELGRRAAMLREQAEIIDQAYDAIIVHDAGRGITLWNQGAARMYGFSKAEALGRVTHELLRTEFPIPPDEIRSALARGLHWEGELTHTRKDGTRLVVESRWVPVRDEGGALTGAALEINRDVTERRRAEAALRASEERYRAFVAQSSEAIWRFELDPPVPLGLPEEEQLERFFESGTLAECNDVMARMYGYERAEELAGSRLADMMPPNEENREYLRAAIRAGYRLTDGESQEVDRDGNRKYFLNNLFGIVEAGLLRRVWGTQRDITERKAAEQERERLLASEREARREAEQANRAKDEFLATLSHELRTPLTPIIGWVHLLGGELTSPADFKHGLAVIDKNSQALSRLISDLLDMSAILNSKMRIDRLPVRVASAVEQAIETVRPQAEKRGVRIELDVDADAAGDGAVVSGDRTRLVQVFWNLLANAVKFSHDGGAVRVRCRREGAEIVVGVEDEGAGIAPDFLPHVFDRFRQADMSTTKVYGGLGIGLALVRSFVVAHGGTVTAESAGAGRGSRFTVRLPLEGLRNADFGLRIEEAAPAPAATVPASAGPMMATASPGTTHATPPVSSNPQSTIRNPQSALRVLVVEDSPDTLEMMRVFFESRGNHVTLCGTAREALDVATALHFDIIVSDIGLPQIDGYELLRALRRERPHLAGTPALALTGYASERDAEAARDAGFAAHLAKPFDPSALAAAVERLLAPGEPGGPSRAARGVPPE